MPPEKSNDSAFDTDCHIPALSQTFREKIRPVLLTISDLRSLGLQHEIRLPAIAVVGDQSVGKSSVLEAISGIEFPRGTGIVTRCPLQLTLTSRDDDIWMGTLRYKTKSGETRETVLKSEADVESAIREAQDAMTKTEKEISDQLIEMRVEGPDCPDLTLIDLPGIARYTSDAGGSIATITKTLILNYITRPEVLILVVVPCHVDIETVEALSLAKEVDPEGKRTIGVLTCPDMVNKGAESEVIAIAKNQKMKLKKGFVTVRCRTPQELKDKKTLKEAAKEEDLFFKTHPYFRYLDKYESGCKTLAIKLSSELFTSIKDSIPDMLKEIQCTREKYAQEIAEMGNGPPEDEENMKLVLVEILNKFSKEFERVATGTHRHEDDRLFARCRTHWNTLANEIEACTLSDSPEAKDLWDFTRSEIERQRGTELPGFDNTYPVLERTVRKKFLVNLKDPTSHFLVNINQEVDLSIRNLADAIFVDFPKLNTHVKSMCEQLRSEKVEKCRDDISKIFIQENYVFTQDRIFLEEEGRSCDTPYQNANGISIGEKAEKDVTLRKDKRKGSDEEDQKVSAVDSKRDKITNETIKEKAKESTDKVLKGVENYIRIAIRRMIDYIPLTVMHYMLFEMSNTLSQSVLYLVTTPESLYELLEEDPFKDSKRRQLKERIEKLQYAEQELAKL